MIYLVDCENVGEAGIEGIEQLSKSDDVFLFYGKAQTSISMETHLALMKAKCRISTLRMNQTGHNYLDMQLAAHAGFLMKERTKAEFTIVSRDKGFDSLIDYLRGKNRQAVRAEALMQMAEESSEPQ